MSPVAFRTVPLLYSAAVMAFVFGSARAENWAHWRGPAQDGASGDTGLPATFNINPKAEKNVIWRAPYGCRSTPVILNKRVYIINGVGSGLTEGERVMCFDADSG